MAILKLDLQTTKHPWQRRAPSKKVLCILQYCSTDVSIVYCWAVHTEQHQWGNKISSSCNIAAVPETEKKIIFCCTRGRAIAITLLSVLFALKFGNFMELWYTTWKYGTLKLCWNQTFQLAFRIKISKVALWSSEQCAHIMHPSDQTEKVLNQALIMSGGDLPPFTPPPPSFFISSAT